MELSTDTDDTDDTDIEIHPAKRAKTEGNPNKNRKLCRTGKPLIMFDVNWLNGTLETMLDAMMVDSEPEHEHEWALSKDFNNAVTDASSEADEIDEAETELTPRPIKKGNQDQSRYVLDLSADDDDEPFQTPLTLRKKLAKERVQVVMDSLSDDQEAEETPVK